MSTETLIILGGLLLAATQILLLVAVVLLSRSLDRERARIRRLERQIRRKNSRSAAQPTTSAIPIVSRETPKAPPPA